jgi:hypothetical protein
MPIIEIAHTGQRGASAHLPDELDCCVKGVAFHPAGQWLGVLVDNGTSLGSHGFQMLQVRSEPYQSSTFMIQTLTSGLAGIGSQAVLTFAKKTVYLTMF